MMVGDGIALSLSFLFSYLLRERIAPELFNRFSIARLEPLKTYIPLLILILVLWIVVGWQEEIYENKGFWEDLKDIWTTDLVTILLALAITYIGKKEFMLSRVILTLTLLTSAILVPVFRLLIKKMAFSMGIGLKKVAIIGKKEEAERLKQEIEREWYAGYRIEGIHEDIRKIEKTLKERGVKEAFIISSCFDQKALNALVLRLEGNVEISLVPDLHKLSLGYGKLKNLGIYMALTPYHRLYKKEDLFIKRAVDLILSSIFVLFLSPLFLLISIMIKIDSRGPIFYRQKRLGKGEKPFTMYKFRSMYQDAEKRLRRILREDPEARKQWEKYKKLKDDPRITRVGKFLRKWSLDELPQLFNVIKGDMSLVGPRPYLPEERGDIGSYRKIIFRVRPGITGLWQIRGRNTLPFKIRLALDEFYVRNWSLWLDFVIFAKTIRAVIERKGAY